MAITGKITNSKTYSGPGTSYEVMNSPLVNKTVNILWREGTFYCLSLSSPMCQCYVPVSAVTNITGGTPTMLSPSYSTRYITTDNPTVKTGPGASYSSAPAPVFPQAVSLITAKQENNYALVDFTRPNENIKRRAWVYAAHLSASTPTAGKYVDSQTINNSGERWIIFNGWGSNRVATGHIGIDLYRADSRNNQTSAKDVYAIAGGTVVLTHPSTNPKGNGNCIVIEHKTPKGKKYYSIYCHLASFYVNQNTTVTAHQKIGLMGQTGNAASVHLHLGITRDNKGADTWGYSGTSNMGSNYYDYPNHTRFYNPTAYFSQGASLIDNNY